MNIKFAEDPQHTETMTPAAAVVRRHAVDGAGNPITVRGLRAAGIAVDHHTADDVTSGKVLDVVTEGLFGLVCDAANNAQDRLTVDATGRGSVADEGVGELVSFEVRIPSTGVDGAALVKIISS
jgi:hypothetical protein